jgi:hypothetical protein
VFSKGYPAEGEKNFSAALAAPVPGNGAAGSGESSDRVIDVLIFCKELLTVALGPANNIASQRYIAKRSPVA